MNKSSYFFGQSVFGQLISFIDLNKIKTVTKQHMSDHYVKKFDTTDHLISMLFSTFAHCTSLREVAASMLGLKGKMSHFQLKNIPYKSTLSVPGHLLFIAQRISSNYLGQPPIVCMAEQIRNH
jgi:hypothetical protein